MRDLEILENIDLDKILQELKARDKAQSNYEKAGNKYNDAIEKYNYLVTYKNVEFNVKKT